MLKVLGIIVPIVLGLIAGVLNWYALQMPTFAYVATKSPVSAGTPFSDDGSEFEIRKVAAEIPGAIPWSDHGLLKGLKAPRDFNANDILLLRDLPGISEELPTRPGEVALILSLQGVTLEPALLRVGREIGFVVRSAPLNQEDPPSVEVGARDQLKILGPFRLTSIGATLTDVELVESSQQVATISVAAEMLHDGSLPSQASELVELNRLNQVVAVVVYPRAR